MSKYAAIYKCQLCGAMLHNGNPTEVPDGKIPDLLAKVIKQQLLMGTPLYQAPMHIRHMCADGSGGLACFVGFKRLD